MDWKRFGEVVLGLILVFPKIVDFLQSLEYVGLKLWILAPILVSNQQGLLFLSLVIGILLITSGLWPDVFIVLNMRVKGIDFEAKIVGKREVYLGEGVRFKARFRGELENGAFTAKVFGPVDTILPDTGQNYTFWACPDTVIQTPKEVGRIKGDRLHEYKWSGIIPTKYPTGKYRAYIRVYDDLGGRNEVIREKEESFTVWRQDEWPLMESAGIGSVLTARNMPLPTKSSPCSPDVA